MTIKKLSTSILITIFIVLSLSACLSELQSNSAKIVISFGGANRAVYNPEDTETHKKLEHKIVLTSEKETLNFTASGGTTFETTVAPGNWNIKVVSYLDGDVYAAGSKDVILFSGLNNETIALYEAHLVKFVSNGGSAVPEQIIFHKQMIPSPFPESKHDSFTFVGWYDSLEEYFDFEKKLIIESITLYAKWKETTVSKDIMGDGYDDSLAGKLSWIKDHGVNGGNYIVEVKASDTSASYDYSLPLPSDKSVSITLTSDKPEMKIIKRSGTGTLFTLNSGVTLTLDNYITLEGNDSNDSALVILGGNCKFIMNPLSKITNNHSVRGGAAVLVYNDGYFLMNGGTISNNKSDGNGGGVTTWNNGEFVMLGGIITGNHSVMGGGGVTVGGESTFTMKGGEISGNYADGVGENGWHQGGGVNVWAKFVMEGGKIYNNHISGADSNDGGGVGVGGTFIMNGGEIYGNTAYNGGGVSVNDGTFTMKGGTISGNTAEENGGGVSVCGNGSFRMTDGSISGNTAGTGIGGGVSVREGSFYMSGNAIISSNKNLVGGGVGVEDNGKFYMTYGTISGNSSTTYAGGGVWLRFGGEFIMSGGIISGNNTPVDMGGGGVSIGINSTFYMSGTAEISNNNTRTGGGVNIWEENGSFYMSGGTISYNTVKQFGGGVSLWEGLFEMTGGKISGNKVEGTENWHSGGGVCVGDNGSFYMTSGTISGNTVNTGGGGGVKVSGATFTMNGGEITGNTAQWGGGVEIWHGIFTKTAKATTGGVISGNTATNNDGTNAVCANNENELYKKRNSNIQPTDALSYNGPANSCSLTGWEP